MRRATATLVALFLLLIGSPASARVHPVTRLVSHSATSASTGATTSELDYSMSGDGRYIAYDANNDDVLTPDLIDNYTAPSPDHSQVYLYDVRTGSNTLVSHAYNLATQASNSVASAPVISRDGHYVVYESGSSDLVSPFSDGNGVGTDIYAYDTTTGTNTLVSRSTTAGTSGNGDSGQSTYVFTKLSADGTKIVFRSLATDLIAGFQDHNTSTKADLFEYDLSSDTMTLVTQTTSALDGANGDLVAAERPSVSSDGTRIAYDSLATDLVPGFFDNNGALAGDIYVFDTATATTHLVSHDVTNAVAGAASTQNESPPHMSANGAVIAYNSVATDLVRGFHDNNGTGSDVFAYNVATGANRLVSHSVRSATAGGNGGSAFPFISDNGATIVYASTATDLVKRFVDGNGGGSDIFRWTSKRGRQSLVTHTFKSNRRGQNGIPTIHGISADGMHVFYLSKATNAVRRTHGTNVAAYIADGPRSRATLASHAFDSRRAIADADALVIFDDRSMSSNGRSIAYLSNASNLVRGFVDGNGSTPFAVDLYRFGP